MLIANEAHKEFTHPRSISSSGARVCRGAGHADSAEDFGKEAFFACSIDEATAGESGRIERTKTASSDGESEDERTDRAENNRTELYGYSCRGGDGGGGEDKDVGDIGKEVGQDNERHGGVDDTGEVAVGRDEFTDNVISLPERLACWTRLLVKMRKNTLSHPSNAHRPAYKATAHLDGSELVPSYHPVVFQSILGV